MGKVHLFSKERIINRVHAHWKVYVSQCGLEFDTLCRMETIDHRPVDCLSCMSSAEYKELVQLDKTMSEIKTEAELEADNNENLMLDREDGRVNINQAINFHYNQSSTSIIEKINEVLDHLEGKINNKQAAQIYNMLKYWDHCEYKDDQSKDLFKCADSIHNIITGQFINEVK